MHTRVLLALIVTLTFLIFLTASLQLQSAQEHNEISDAAALCSAYFKYVDDTHKTIGAVEKMCWRTIDATTDPSIK